MPAKNSRKQYLADSYYHLYNRGVDKQLIFRDKQDYGVFLGNLKLYLTPKDEKQLQKQLANPEIPWLEKDKFLKLLRLNNFADEISLLAYCLMPNHFHLLLHQKHADGIDRFMNSFNTRYVMSFNKKYQRVGPLYQGTYKAVLVGTDEQLLYLSAYIHRNPAKLPHDSLQGHALQKLMSQPSSLREYIERRKTSWVKSQKILSYFSRNYNPQYSYQKFVMEAKELEFSIGHLLIE